MVELGVHHEMQHQELMLMDILNLLAANPIAPSYRAGKAAPDARAAPLKWRSFEAKLRRIGHEGGGFAYDCETPAHEFMWAASSWRAAPLPMASGCSSSPMAATMNPAFGYPTAGIGATATGSPPPCIGGKTIPPSSPLAGLVDLNEEAPVCHVSYYEAYAFAKYAGHRLPTEQEWETAARHQEAHGGNGDFADGGALTAPVARGGILQPGGVWEWTASAFLPYPGYVPPPSALGEYNGKFMSSQMVMRGGSFATPRAHYRPTYRNFFYPHMRWQFGGLRLAADS